MVFSFNNIFTGIINFRFIDLCDSIDKDKNSHIQNGKTYFSRPSSLITANEGSGAFMIQQKYEKKDLFMKMNKQVEY